jgi:hypothetical protein
LKKYSISILSFLRGDGGCDDMLFVACYNGAALRGGSVPDVLRLAVDPREVLNSDTPAYGGSGVGGSGGSEGGLVLFLVGRYFTSLTPRPLGGLFLKKRGSA